MTDSTLPITPAAPDAPETHAPAPDAALHTTPQDSYHRYLHQLDRPERAARYPSQFDGSLRQRRERRALEQLIALIPAQSLVLDLPCGTGRVTRLILQAGHAVLGGDSAPAMLAEAERQLQPDFPQARFQVMSAAATGLADRSVDAVVCNRLLHHFAEPDVRIGVLREFARVSRGPVIVSFSSAFGVDVAWQKLTRRLQGRELQHYFPIPLRQLQSEFAAAGLRVTGTRAVMWGLSRMWYVVGERQ